MIHLDVFYKNFRPRLFLTISRGPYKGWAYRVSNIYLLKLKIHVHVYLEQIKIVIVIVVYGKVV